MRNANGYDGKGCTADSCIPECQYFKPCLYPELFSLSKMEIDSNGQLLKRLFRLYSELDPTIRKQSN